VYLELIPVLFVMRSAHHGDVRVLSLYIPGFYWYILSLLVPFVLCSRLRGTCI